MNEIFKRKKIIIILGGVCIFVILFIWCLFSRENVHDNRDAIDGVRDELNKAEGAKQDITNTAGDIQNATSDLEGTIKDATNTSTSFDKILGECQNILEQIRNQPNEN